MKAATTASSDISTSSCSPCCAHPREQLRADVRGMGGRWIVLVPADRIFFQRKSAGDAANKAFITNRIGDARIISACFSSSGSTGSLRYVDVNAAARSGHFLIGDPIITAATLLSVCRGLRQVGAAPSLCMAARCNGRAHARFGADPRGNDGDGWRLHGSAIERAVHTRADIDEDGRDRGRADWRSSPPRLDWCRTTSSACSRTPRSRNLDTCSSRSA